MQQPPPDTPEPAAPETLPADIRTGPEIIAAYVKQLPSAPGVYRMIDAEGDVIYVGKARSLKARVSNYARLGGHSNRIARMISRTASMEFVRVNTEAEALLLEANLIKRFRPRFNVLMRDDKSFPYILIADTNDAPLIVKHRGARNRKGEYFGPFASAGAVDRTINMLQRAFLLRTCSDSVFESRTRPCLLYQIKRCAGPCTGEIATEAYAELVAEAVRFLRGESQNVRQMYQRLMEEAAEKLEFETAAKYRNRLWALAHVTSETAISAENVEEADVFAAHQEGGQTCIQVFFFRAGQNWGNRAYFPKADRSLGPEDVLESFIAQFYDDKPVPRLILISHDVESRDLLAEALTVKATRKVQIQVPRRGDKTALIQHAVQNAREALGRKLAESSSQRALLEGVAERFGLATTPRRIEVYDNSHIMGTNAVGAMIVAGPEGLIKNQYRKFNIKSEGLTPGDDYAMMREVLTRRFKRLLKEQGETEGDANEDTVAGDSTTSSRPSPQPPPREEQGGGEPPSPHPSWGEGRGEGQTHDEKSPLSQSAAATVQSTVAAEIGEQLPREQRDPPPSGAPAQAPGAQRRNSAVSEEANSRITEPAPPPIRERGADAIPFGTVPADITPSSGPSPQPPPREEQGGGEPPSPHTSWGEGRGEGQPHDAKTATTQLQAEDHDEAVVSAPETNSRGATRPAASDIAAANVAKEDTAPAEPALAQQGTAGVSEEDSDLFLETPDWPDLVLVDGGAGQLSVAREVFDDLGVTNVALVGVAKGPDRDAGREHFHIPGQPRPVMLEPRDPVLYFVQRLRDEAHRFAIGTHRAKRTKAIAANPLDEIAGIGPTRKRALLAHFGSAKSVSRAGVEDLKSVPGISAEMAQKIYDFFHDRQT